MSSPRELLPCEQADSEYWFTGTRAAEAWAKAQCQTCPIINECLLGAFERNEEYGIFGGLTAQERRELQRRKGQTSVSA